MSCRRSGASEGGDACHQRNHHEKVARRAHGAGKAEIFGEGAEWGDMRGWSEVWLVWSRDGRARGPREQRVKYESGGHSPIEFTSESCGAFPSAADASPRLCQPSMTDAKAAASTPPTASTAASPAAASADLAVVLDFLFAANLDAPDTFGSMV